MKMTLKGREVEMQIQRKCWKKKRRTNLVGSVDLQVERKFFQVKLEFSTTPQNYPFVYVPN